MYSSVCLCCFLLKSFTWKIIRWWLFFLLAVFHHICLCVRFCYEFPTPFISIYYTVAFFVIVTSTFLFYFTTAIFFYYLFFLFYIGFFFVIYTILFEYPTKLTTFPAFLLSWFLTDIHIYV